MTMLKFGKCYAALTFLNKYCSREYGTSFFYEISSRMRAQKHFQPSIAFCAVPATTDFFKGKLVPRARLALATPGFSGPRSTT